MSNLPIAVQLYTLRDLTTVDFAGAIAEVARMGYAGVELAGYGNLKSPSEVRKVLDDHGLKVAGSHAPIERLETDLNRVLDENETLGNRNIVCPWLAEGRRKDASDWRDVAKSLNRIGGECRQRGFEFAYHNHAFEFVKFTLCDPTETAAGANPPTDSSELEKSGLDILFDETDPALVKSELDVYWVQHGGADPIVWMKKLGPRCLLLHLKDMAAGGDRKFAPVGEGVLDFSEILKAAREAGVKWGIVEQDNTYDVAPLDAVRTSFENLRKLGAVQHSR
jgi:sugar phosphate isomerase/epimerase